MVVAVADPAGTGREWTPLVREAVTFWEAESERFAGYPIDYDVRPDATDPDIVIEFVDTVPECDGVAVRRGARWRETVARVVVPSSARARRQTSDAAPAEERPGRGSTQ